VYMDLPDKIKMLTQSQHPSPFPAHTLGRLKVAG
jgi:hypothetical protein